MEGPETSSLSTETHQNLRVDAVLYGDMGKKTPKGKFGLQILLQRRFRYKQLRLTEFCHLQICSTVPFYSVNKITISTFL